MVYSIYTTYLKLINSIDVDAFRVKLGLEKRFNKLFYIDEKSPQYLVRCYGIFCNVCNFPLVDDTVIRVNDIFKAIVCHWTEYYRLFFHCS